MGPIDYSLNVQSPFESALQGYQIGNNMAEMQAKRKAQQLAIQQAQAQAERQKQVQTETANLFSNPNPTAKDFIRVASMLPEKEAASMRANWDALNKDRQEQDMGFAGQTLAAFNSGANDVGIGLLKQRAEASRNGGDEAQAKAYDTWAQLAEQNPKAVMKSIGLMVARLPGGEKVIEGVTKLGSEARAEAMQPSALTKAESEAQKAKVEADFAERLQTAGLNEKNWNVKNLQSQIGTRAQQLKLDSQKVAMEVAEKMSNIQKNLTELPPDTRKLVNESAVDAAASKQAANQFNELATKLDQAGGGWGAASSANEWIRKNTGMQGGMSELRNEYTRVRNTAMAKQLKSQGGTASDTDVRLALEGFPPATADSKTLASFLRGIAKIQDMDASINNAKTDWLTNNNGTLGRARGAFLAGDYSTKPGETYQDFTTRVATDVSKRYNGKSQEEKSAATVAQIPTKDGVKPPANDVRSRADAILGGR